MLVRRHLLLRAPVQEERDLRPEPLRLDCDVDRGVSAADDGDPLSDGRRLACLQLLDERQRLPDSVQVVAFVRHVEVRAHSDCEHDRVDLGNELLQARRVHSRAEAELHSELGKQPCLVGQRLVRLPIRRDRVADEPADLRTLVVDGHGVASCGELSGRSEPCRAGADNGDATCRSPSATGRSCTPFAYAHSVAIALERTDLDRPPSLVDQDAILLAEHLDRADARAGPAEDVLGEDDPCGRRGIVRGDGRDEARHVDVRRAADDARRGRMRAAALETAIRLDEGRLRRQPRAKLARQLVDAHPWTKCGSGWCRAIGVGPECSAGRPQLRRAASGRSRAYVVSRGVHAHWPDAKTRAHRDTGHAGTGRR